MTTDKKPATTVEAKPQSQPVPKGPTLAELAAEIAALKATMRRNGWTVKD